MRFLRRLLPYPVSRANYWSCSSFAVWVREKFGKFEKPRAATLEEWKDWKATTKAQHGFVYWLTEEAFNHVQDIVMFPADVWDAIRTYIRNRFVDKPHYLKTKLKPGHYYELDTRILHGLFEELVDFIECEKAWMTVVFDEKAKEKYNYPKRPRWLRFGSFRCPQAGIDHLHWEMSLKYGDNDGVETDDPMWGKPTSQAIAAEEELALYDWWKNQRPLRPDPYDVIEDKTDDDRYMKMFAEEERQHLEDEQMLIRLIKIRRNLWT